MLKDTAPRLLIAAGGSGGHLFPAQAIARLMQNKGVEIFFAGAGLNQSPFFDRGSFSHCEIDSPPLSLNFRGLISKGIGLIKGIRRAKQFFSDHHFDAILGFGSFHTVATLLVGTSRRIPLLLHEANAKPGKTVRLFAPFAKSIAVQFDNLSDGRWHKRAVLTQMPVKKSDIGDLMILKKDHLKAYGLKEQLPTLLIFGGSQGANYLNVVAPKALALLSHRNFQVLHLAGQGADCAAIAHSYRKANITASVRPFEDNMQRAWSVADCALCRAGSSTLAEIGQYCVPALLIPYPAAGGHQIYNAQQMIKQTQGMVMISQKEATVENLKIKLKELFQPDQILLRNLKAALNRFCQKPKPLMLQEWVWSQLNGQRS